MAIKVNWQDLQARYINGQSIGKVMLNWQQIRPTVIPPQPITAWVYWNSTLWLISLSKNWTTWITMADKNVWASTVYAPDKFSLLEPITSSNSWTYHQWGNNYWFPYTWSVTTSASTVDVTWYGQWNYYNSSTFITTSPWFTWTSSGLWSGQWPCPAWYHIGTYNDWSDVQSILRTLYHTWPYYDSPWDIPQNILHTYFLKLPYGWKRVYSTSDVDGQWDYWYYNLQAYRMGQYGTVLWGTNIDDTKPSDWWFARPFLDTPVEPDSTWVRMWLVAWSYWNQSLWLISFTADGYTWYTMSDKNLWANTVYNTWDQLTQNNCGLYYQWGNNYWFSMQDQTLYNTQVDVTWYGVGNYYSNSEFHSKSRNPYTPTDTNLWGWYDKVNSSDDDAVYNVVAQWPCDSWFHIPNYTETLAMASLNNRCLAWTSFKMPNAWYIFMDGRLLDVGDTVWCRYAINLAYQYTLSTYAEVGFPAYSFNQKSWGYNSEVTYWIARPLRPMKDTPVIPDGTWTVLFEEAI